MNQEIKDKLSKVYALVNQGATEGERAAARNLLDKILKRHKIEGINLDRLDVKRYAFKYKSELDVYLWPYVVRYFVPNHGQLIRNFQDRVLKVDLKYLDWVSISCAWAYFRPHMKAQWNAICLPLLKKKRSLKTKNAFRKALTEPFVVDYMLKSGLMSEKDTKKEKLSAAESQLLGNVLDQVEGGNYKVQVQTAHQLPAAKKQETGQLKMF